MLTGAKTTNFSENGIHLRRIRCETASEDYLELGIGLTDGIGVNITLQTAHGRILERSNTKHVRILLQDNR
jgi:hypothetical protein